MSHPPNDTIKLAAGEKKSIHRELWQACAGPLVDLPPAGTHVVYFPQGHSEQISFPNSLSEYITNQTSAEKVAVSMRKDVDAKIPSYPNLGSQLICLLHNVTLHADPETDEVYAQMTLQPVSSLDKDALLRSDLALKMNKPQTEFFCKTLTASDTSTHGGFSVPRRAAEKIFPPLDFSVQPPVQELVARDLHENVWTFRHIYRGQPKRHLLTTGWSLFVSGKRLFAGDSVLFIRDEKQHLLLGVRRANRQPTNLSSSVLSSDSMHIGILAAAAHAAANNSPFTVFYNPRASPSEFVIPLAKYCKAVAGYQLSLGMRFRMMFETEDSGTRRYMGTITGISDLDPVRWKNSQWRNLQIGWDESTAGERCNRVSCWEIEPVTVPFFMYPPFFRSKRPRQPGLLDDDPYDLDSLFNRSTSWVADDIYAKDTKALPYLSIVHWMNMQRNTALRNSMQPDYMQSLSGSVLQNLAGTDLSHQLGSSLSQLPLPSISQLNSQRPPQQGQHDQLPKLPSSPDMLSSIIQMQQQPGDITEQSRQNLPSSTSKIQIKTQLQPLIYTNNILQQQSSVQSHQLRGDISQSLQQQQQTLNQQQIMGPNVESSLMRFQLPDQVSQHPTNNQSQLQVLQKLQQQQLQQSLLAKQSAMQQPGQLSQLQDPQRQLLGASHSLCRSITPSEMLDLPQATYTSLSWPRITQQQSTRNNHQSSTQFYGPQHLKLLQGNPDVLREMHEDQGTSPGSVANQLSTAGSSMLTVARESGITDDVPSWTASPFVNSYPKIIQSVMNDGINISTEIGEDMAPSVGTVLSPSFLDTIPYKGNLVKDLKQESEFKSSLNVYKNQNQGLFGPQAHINGAATLMDCLDTSSSTTSVCPSQNDVQVQQNNNSVSYNAQSVLTKTENSISHGTRIDGHLGMPPNSDHQLTKGMEGLGNDFSNNLLPGDMPAKCEIPKDPLSELSSSMASQSFGVPGMASNSIDSANNNSSFIKRGSWAPAPQFQPKRTYTKVYKRGAVGRSIDISRYSGYNELKLDLARRFGIEGELEDHQKIGWKLVYVDHENDILLVGDDPWEEFVNCVRCIKILSPQEVEQMSLDGGFGNSVLPKQTCSSSDNGKL